MSIGECGGWRLRDGTAAIRATTHSAFFRASPWRCRLVGSREQGGSGPPRQNRPWRPPNPYLDLSTSICIYLESYLDSIRLPIVVDSHSNSRCIAVSIPSDSLINYLRTSHIDYMCVEGTYIAVSIPSDSLINYLKISHIDYMYVERTGVDGQMRRSI